MEKFDHLQLLPFIDPDDYEVWYQVGMALKHEGYSCDDWDRWSQGSPKYHPGDCEKKWNSFQEDTSKPVTGAYITIKAKEGGWEPNKTAASEPPRFLAWDAVIGKDTIKPIVDEGFTEIEPLPEPPKNWSPREQLTTYINTLFQPDDIVAFCMQAIKKEDGEKVKWVPANAGSYSKTAAQLLKELQHYDDISYAFGDYKKEAGAWIRFNPFDGNGIKNENVTDFRYTLVECDDMSLEKQYSLIKQMKLPVAVLVHSGGKSLHAIVKVDALDKDDYAKKVQFLYQTCEKSGLKIDTKNKNPSRLSRMPGVERNGKKQYIVATNIGCENWEKWIEYVTLLDNDLPDPEPLSKMLADPPPLAEEVIEGILRQGHKMLISGASKAGKSFLLMELCLAISTGTKWLKWKCKKGRVLYINLEIDRASCFDRFCKILEQKGMGSEVFDNVEIMNLRGKAAPMDKLVDRLILKAKERDYSVIIIDPLYKVITGDENTASDMAHFMNQFDKLAEALGCSVICCHHHSKGTQADKRVADRASGSGVFARDTDALLDMVELEISAELRHQILNDHLCSAYCEYLGEDNIPENERTNVDCLERRAETWTQKSALKIMRNEIQSVVDAMTAWRVEGTLREFPGFPPVNMWFSYPVHSLEVNGLLDKAQAVGAQNPYKKGGEAVKQAAESKKLNDDLRFKACFEALAADHEEVTQQELFDAFNKSREDDYEKPLSRSTLTDKLNQSRYLDKIVRGRDKTGKQLSPIIKAKKIVIHEDFPEGFMEPDD